MSVEDTQPNPGFTEQEAADQERTQDPDLVSPIVHPPIEPFSRSDSGNIMETMMLPEGGIAGQNIADKQETDLAFVVTLVQSGKVNERQLARALDAWTIYGRESLADRAVAENLISEHEKQSLLRVALKRLRATEQTLSQSGVQTDKSSMSRAKIAHLDSSGRLSRILGLNNTGTLAADNEARQLFSRFSLIRKLGEGGLGTVWLARDENLRRYVAIKEIRSSRAKSSPAAMARFRREAEVTGRLEHPGIVPIYQFGTDSDSGNFFYVMRFLGKHTMQDAIIEYHERREAGNDEPLLMHRLLTSFVKLCYSVAHAHSRKVVHRDLKPENVALDNFGEVVLLDWGLAKINDDVGIHDTVESDDDDSEDNSLTMANQVLGSPLYMAPEQAAGRLDEIDERTDVYGLGGILFAILTGQAPHEQSRDTSETGSMSDLLQAIVSRTTVNARELNSDVPPEIDAICNKALQNKRYLRYATASALAEDIERFMAGDKVTAYNEPWNLQIKRWISAHPRFSQVFGVLGIVTFLTLTIFGYSLRQSQVAENAFRFQQASDIAKELSFNLQSEADNVIRDTRFLAALPPVQEIIDASARMALRPPAATDHAITVSQETNSPDATIDTSGIEEQDLTTQAIDTTHEIEPDAPIKRVKTTPSETASDQDDASLWFDRFSAIIEGLLRRNESYLAIAFLKVDEEVQQLVRSERNPGAGFVRRVPNSLLKTFAKQVEGGPDYESMLPGDVTLQTSDQINQDAPTNFRDSLSLTAINSIFDNKSGELFGLMAIQIDLRRLIEERLEAISRDDVRVYVTNGLGVIEMVYSEGRVIPDGGGIPISDVFPQLAVLFLDKSVETNYSDGSRLYGLRLRLGQKASESQAEVGIVVEVTD